MVTGLSLPHRRPSFRNLAHPTHPTEHQALLLVTRRQQTSMLRQRYRIRSKISSTLYGAVCLCEDTLRADQPVAIKQVDLVTAMTVMEQCSNIDNPWTEQQAVAALQRLPPHANVLRFHQAFVHNESWFLVMEYCADGDLWRVLQQSPNNRLPEDEARGVFWQIAAGVRYLHSHAIAHRDLSLENVLVSDGVCKLCDFGLCTAATSVCNDRVGKAYYMAPEVVAGQAYDPVAADMWSLGIVLFIILTGSPLTLKAGPMDDAVRALSQFGVRSIFESWGISALVSTDASDLVSALLQVDPAKRPTVEAVMKYSWLQE
jgi:serine/threonine protein kinase